MICRCDGHGREMRPSLNSQFRKVLQYIDNLDCPGGGGGGIWLSR